MSDPEHRPLEFPARGLHVAEGHWDQPPLTSPAADNVKLVNPGSLRRRGGSRGGLSRFIKPDDLLHISSDVQCLNVVVTANGEAQPWSRYDTEDNPFDPYNDTTVTDPRTPTINPPSNPDYPVWDDTDENRKWPPGGDGHPQDPLVGKPPIARDDTATAALNGGSTDCSVLTNDSYDGTPTIEIAAGPRQTAATAVVSGSGASSVITYTSKPGYVPHTDQVDYYLTATSNSGRSLAFLRLDVSNDGSGTPVGWRYTQKKFEVQAGAVLSPPPITGSLTLPSTEDNQLLLVAVGYFSDYTWDGAVFQHDEPDVTISGGGLTWTELTRRQTTQAGAHFDTNLTVFWARNTTAGNIAIDVTLTRTGIADAIQKFCILAVEYGGLLNSTPYEFEAGSSANPAPGPPHTVTSGATSQNGNTRLNVMFVTTVDVFGAIADPPTPAAGYTLRASENQDSGGDVASLRMYLIDDLSTPSGATVTPSMSCDFNTGEWCAVSSTFRYS